MFLALGRQEIADNGGLDSLTGNSSQAEANIWCHGYRHTQMDDDQRRMVVTARPGCWSGWITVPVTTDQFWIFAEKGSIIKIQFIDGTEIVDNTNRAPVWLGESTGIFRVRSLNGENTTITITVRLLR